MTSLTPFISRDDLSDYLGRDVTTDDGALIAIDAACDMVRTLSEQDFNEVTSTVTLDGTGTDTLILPQLPASAVGTVTVGGTVSSGTVSGGSAVTNWMLRDDGVLMRTAGAAINDGDTVPMTWPKGRQNVAVSYTHGYGTAVLPRDVRMVALSIATRLIVQGAAQYETVGDVNVRYAVASTDFTKGEMAILRKYRR